MHIWYRAKRRPPIVPPLLWARLGLLLLSPVIGGCVFEDPFVKELRATRLQVESLEQRVTHLEASTTGAGGGMAVSPALAAEAEADIGTVAASGTRGGFRFPPVFSRNALGKLGRGVVNTITGWVEIPKRMHETSQQSGLGAGFTFGLIRGVGYGCVRTLAGVYEVVTFPFPAPPGYQPLMHPEYVFTNEYGE